MNKTLILLLTMFLASAGFSQTKPSFIALNFGPSYPVGEYAGTSDLQNDGYAKTGYNLSFEGAYFISRSLGFGADVGLNTHNMDESALSKIKSTYPGVVIANYTADPYKVMTFMAGIYGNIGVTRNLSLTVKLLAGGFSARMPEQSLTWVDINNLSHDESITSSSDLKLSVLGGAGVKYGFTDRFGLSLQVEYTAARPEFEYGADNKKLMVEQQFSIVNLLLGVNFFIGR